MNIKNIGFSEAYLNHKDEEINESEVARIITVEKESYIITDGSKEYFSKLTGNLIYSASSPEDYPTVGDFVIFQKFDDESLTIITEVLPRKTVLKRKSPGKKIDYQLIAANIDYAIIMQGMDNNYNVNRIERYLSMVNEFGIEPIILLNKTDLISEEVNKKRKFELNSRLPQNRIIFSSNFNESNIEKVRSNLTKGKTYCIIGSSGVGKTTLLNNLVGGNHFKTKEVRDNDSRGRHTTTKRHLVVLPNGAMFIDTPGMRELANITAFEGIDKTFDEISELSNGCKYSDCTHTIEKGCAILVALENGDLVQQKYDNYIKLKKESNYLERSYVEKRQRDKEFGKMVKSILKNKRFK